MTWTTEKLAQIPEVYRDFMMVLRPVVDSRKPGVILRITGIPFGTLVSTHASAYSFESEEVRQIADNLRRAGLVEEDRLGFFTPTTKGEELIEALAEAEPMVERVPPLPSNL